MKQVNRTVAGSRTLYLLHVGDTCTLFRMPASVNTFGCTPLYTFVFAHVLLVLNTKLFSPRLFESLGITMRLVILGIFVYRVRTNQVGTGLKEEIQGPSQDLEDYYSIEVILPSPIQPL